MLADAILVHSGAAIWCLAGRTTPNCNFNSDLSLSISMINDLSMREHRDSQTAQNSSRETYHTATTGKDETFAWFVWLKHVHCRLETRISGAARIALQP